MSFVCWGPNKQKFPLKSAYCRGEAHHPSLVRPAHWRSVLAGKTNPVRTTCSTNRKFCMRFADPGCSMQIPTELLSSDYTNLPTCGDLRKLNRHPSTYHKRCFADYQRTDGLHHLSISERELHSAAHPEVVRFILFRFDKLAACDR